MPLDNPVKVMSWNIQKFGDKGLAPNNGMAGAAVAKSALVDFIAQLVTEQDVEVLGIVEVVKGLGNTLTGFLTDTLNNMPVPLGATWRGISSARQTKGTQEEYIYIWLEQDDRLERNANLTASPYWLINIVDHRAFDTFLATKGWGATEMGQLQQGLKDEGYIAKVGSVWRLTGTGWNELNQVGATLRFPAGNPLNANLTDADKALIQQQLLNIDFIKFTTNNDRSPFLINYTIDGNRALNIALYHAPGPQTNIVYSAINALSLSSFMQNAENLMLMGDFNVEPDNNIIVPTYNRIINGPVVTFGVNGPAQEVFNPIINAPLNTQTFAFDDPVNDGGTSLTTVGRVLDNADRVPTNAWDLQARLYDNFLVRSNANNAQALNSQNPAINLVPQMISQNQGTYVAALGLAAMRAFKQLSPDTWLDNKIDDANRQLARAQLNLTDAQAALAAANAAAAAAAAGGANAAGQAVNRKRGRNPQDEVNRFTDDVRIFTNRVNTLTAIRTAIAPAVVTAAPNLATGFVVYRRIISDHLPISTQINTP